VNFEWDAAKEIVNEKKHGVNFSEARAAFYDSKRVIAHDDAHSQKEPRFFCIGKTERGILTVRFTLRGDTIRIIGAGLWRKGKKFYEETN
jgi:uncharacterized DUF497 family protein